ncbi:hypothetical protein [Yoonia sediminilitoris]|nr:hypothetical protein [Yoonia sediminilitoris]
MPHGAISADSLIAPFEAHDVGVLGDQFLKESPMRGQLSPAAWGASGAGSGMEKLLR